MMFLVVRLEQLNTCLKLIILTSWRTHGLILSYFKLIVHRFYSKGSDCKKKSDLKIRVSGNSEKTTSVSTN